MYDSLTDSIKQILSSLAELFSCLFTFRFNSDCCNTHECHSESDSE